MPKPKPRRLRFSEMCRSTIRKRLRGLAGADLRPDVEQLPFGFQLRPVPEGSHLRGTA